MAARATSRRLMRPPLRNGRPNAAMDARSMTVLSRSKKAASICLMVRASGPPPLAIVTVGGPGRERSVRVTWAVVGLRAGCGSGLLVRDEQRVHRVLGLGGNEHEHLVAGLQRRVAPGDDEAIGPDDCDDDGVAREVEVGDGGVAGR